MNDASRTEHKILLYVDILSSLISDKDWELFCREGYEITNSPIWKEFEWKVKMRFFSTPLVVWKFNGSSDKCWRGCGLVGDQTHIFWDFQRLLGYWQNILHTQLCMEVCVCWVKKAFFSFASVPATIFRCTTLLECSCCTSKLFVFLMLGLKRENPI